MQSSLTKAGRTAVIRASIILAALIAITLIPYPYDLTRHYFVTQDVFVVTPLLAVFLHTRFRLPHVTLPAASPPRLAVWTVAVALCLLLWAGTYAIMHNYPLTRDEHMVVFDMQIYGEGRLSQPLPPEWQGFGIALAPAFLLDLPDHAALVSAYMPVNAAMRAAFAKVADPALMNPLLVATGFIATWSIARKVFADCPGAIWVVLGAYLLSAQVLVAGMTTYAMTGHLAFNLVWLALFLCDTRWAHAVAMLTGLATIGLHQVIFHPLFAGPFILTLLLDRRWRLFALYAAVYAAGLLFWISWPQIVAQDAALVAQTGSAAGGGNFLTNRVLPLILDQRPSAIPLMAYNLLRALAWNAAYLLPFLLLAVPAIRSDRKVALPLFAGSGLTIVAMAILLPYQGHGWGYRYIHGLLGSVVLLAGFGYRVLAREAPQAAGGIAAILGAFSLLSLPFLAHTASGFVRPYAELSERIERQDADFVVIDTETMRAAIDQVRNRADLGNHPLVFSSADLSDAQLAELCERGRMVVLAPDDVNGADAMVQNAGTDAKTRIAQAATPDCARPFGSSR